MKHKINWKNEEEVRDYYREYKKKWYEEHKEERKAYMEIYRREHKEEIKAYNKKYDKKYNQEHKEGKKAYNKKYNQRLENKEKRKAYGKKWHKEHPEEKKASNHKRRARKKGNGGSYTKEEITQLRKETKGICLGYNREPHFVGDKNLEIEHIIALANGGTNEIENIQLMCGSCNRNKGTN